MGRDTMPRRSKGPWFKQGRGWHVQHQGKRIFLSRDKAEARKLWHKIQAGEPIEEPTGATFATAAEAYLDEMKRTRSFKHYRGTRWRLDQLSEHWAKRALGSLRNADVEAVLRLHPQWNATTQATVLTALRGLLRWASRPGGLIPVNPLPTLALPRAERRVNVMTMEQIAELLCNARRPLLWILWALAETGARPSELIRARAEHCDDDGAAIRLPTGKQGRRIIFFPPSARAVMARLKKEAKGGPLFRQKNGEAWSEYWFFHQTRAARRRAKLPEWATAYVLRHTFASNRLKEGIPIATVARMMGTSVTMIDRVYGHFADQDLRAVADGLG